MIGIAGSRRKELPVIAPFAVEPIIPYFRSQLLHMAS